jgi:hypothetical protein
MDSIKDSQTFKILNEIANMNFVIPCYNERYLHHYFTEKIQKDYSLHSVRSERSGGNKLFPIRKSL